MVSNIIIVLFHIFISFQICPSMAQTNNVRIGYYSCSKHDFPVANINFSLFTHIICAFARINSTSYQLSLSPDEEKLFSNLTETVKQKHPSVTTLLSLGGSKENVPIFSSMASNPSHRKSFIDSSIEIARLYGFQGLDLAWQFPINSSDTSNMGVLLQEWQSAVALEARNSSQSELILTAMVEYSPFTFSRSYPIEAIQKYLNWVNLGAGGYHNPQKNVTGANAALYDPNSDAYTDQGLREWMDGGLSANKLVLRLPLYGCAWKLVNPEDNGIGAPATGPGITKSGYISYKDIKNHIKVSGRKIDVKYNPIYVVNYCTIESSWIGFDDVQAIKAKVSYAKEKKLLGYYVWRVGYDDNWVLSQAAAEADINNSSDQEDSKRPLLAIILSSTAAVILLLGLFVIYYWRRRKLESRGKYFKLYYGVLQSTKGLCFPPEFLRRGIYSTKFDVYSFGVLFVEIISGKRVNGSLNFLDYDRALQRHKQGSELGISGLPKSAKSGTKTEQTKFLTNSFLLKLEQLNVCFNIGILLKLNNEEDLLQRYEEILSPVKEQVRISWNEL
ncbi:hypothetical protein Pint_14670 [Pistacia integerrima]|uniref:Uncharacterized protein n=1 Tax=Pistacia integerrima TaxID=434235 RepID=A0ACC0Y8H9_9ROSI|nr:hypothetical protein Pint_14670 [Pistacia integerrima]